MSDKGEEQVKEVEDENLDLSNSRASSPYDPADATADIDITGSVAESLRPQLDENDLTEMSQITAELDEADDFPLTIEEVDPNVSNMWRTGTCDDSYEKKQKERAERRAIDEYTFDEEEEGRPLQPLASRRPAKVLNETCPSPVDTSSNNVLHLVQMTPAVTEKEKTVEKEEDGKENSVRRRSKRLSVEPPLAASTPKRSRV